MQRLHAQIPTHDFAWKRELWLRYSAATVVTLVALLGAQLLVRTDFVVALALVTLMGTPVSIALRLRQMRVGSIHIARPVWNAITVVSTFFVAGFYLMWSLREFLEGWNGSMAGFWLRFGAGDSMSLLIQIFLIFAAFRSFALISDKDCTLATVPSFSVLLLLIPVQKGIEVVAYFVVWTIFAAILFALDHRSEQRSLVVGVVASPQDASKMAARSLGSILGISLLGAVGFSAFLATRNPGDRSEAETAITSLATRLTQVALSLPDVSGGGGPERSIDFSSGPSLPTQTILWSMAGISLREERVVPEYIRLFSLSQYNGTIWGQTNLGQKSVRRRLLKRPEWPLPLVTASNPPNNFQGQTAGGGPTFSLSGSSTINPSFDPRGVGSAREERRPGQNQRVNGIGLDRRTALRPGFPFGSTDPRKRAEFGFPTIGVRQIVRAQTTNLGFLPTLPSAQTVRLPDSTQNEIRTRRDGAVDIGIMQAGQVARIFSLVPRLKEYGFPSGIPPAKNVAPRPDSPVLTRLEREVSLKLPPTVPERVRELGRKMLRDVKPNESNYKKANRIAFALSQDAVYTLRPPTIPNGRDAADYFLFEGNKRGYCTYFAGALAVLCRTQGIPARVATGFAGMETNSDGFATVRDANAHAWTEVWVENWGWALVDATPASDRGDNAPTWIENWNDVFGAVVDNTRRWAIENWSSILLGATTIAALLFALTRRRSLNRWWVRRLVPEREAELARREIVELYTAATRPLARKFRPRRDSETPDEWLLAVLQVAPQSQQSALQALTALYVRAAFSPAPLSNEALQNAREAARALK